MNANLQAGYGAQAAQPTTLPVLAAQNDLDANIQQLNEALGALRERLAGVLGPSKPQSVDNMKNGPQAVPSVANRIYSSAGAVRQAREAVGELLDRLEV